MAAASSAAAAAADMHFKMCKKIALLTKVIYHLNIKSEDHDAAVAALRAQHADAVAAVAAEAAARLAKLTDTITGEHEREVAALRSDVAAAEARAAAVQQEAAAAAAKRDDAFRCVARLAPG